MIDLSDIQPLKAPAPMDDGFPEIIIFSTLVHPLKAFSGIAVSPFKVIVFKEAGKPSLSVSKRLPIALAGGVGTEAKAAGTPKAG